MGLLVPQPKSRMPGGELWVWMVEHRPARGGPWPYLDQRLLHFDQSGLHFGHVDGNALDISALAGSLGDDRSQRFRRHLVHLTRSETDSDRWTAKIDKITDILAA